MNPCPTVKGYCCCKTYPGNTLLNKSCFRLRQTDVKAGHYERKVQALEAARDQWEEKYEEMNEKYKKVQQELQDFQAEIGNI